MGKLAQLLKYADEVTLINQRTGEKVEKVWVRLLGDDDLREAFKFSRIASAKKRARLRNPESSDTLDDLAQLSEQPRSELIDIIIAAREESFKNDASVTVDREDLPEIASVAKRPDAPTLEESEKLETLITEQEAAYDKRIAEYVKDRIDVLRADLESMPDEEVHKIASEELINVQALQEFLNELNDQKGFRGTFTDKECTVRGFDTIEEFKAANTGIREQLISAYNALEVSGDEIKK